jgi:hypothetical protein
MMTFSRNIFATLLLVFTACNAFADQYQGLQLSTRDISTLAALKVTPEYVQEMRAYFPNISAKDITSLYALKVTPVYLKEMRSLFPNMSVRDVISLYALKVPPSYVKEIRDLGYDDISIREITSFYALKVKPEYIKQMREAGQPVVAGQEVHIPEIHVQIPEIHIPEISVDLSHAHSEPSFLQKIAKVAGGIAMALAVLFLAGFGFFVWRRYNGEGDTHVEEDLNVRMTHFENRVNDLQDILLSIDDRLDRRLKRT